LRKEGISSERTTESKTYLDYGILDAISGEEDIKEATLRKGVFDGIWDIKVGGGSKNFILPNLG